MFKEIPLTLSWKITPLTQKKQLRRVIFIVGPILIIYAFTFYLFYPLSTSYTIITGGISDFVHFVFYGGVAVAGAVFITYVLSGFIPFQERSYFLDEQEVIISKGLDKRSFLWNVFECFYIYKPLYAGDNKPILYPHDAFTIEGSIFYCKKRSNNFFAKFYKSYVVIYSLPENSSSVFSFLISKLPEKKMSNTTELGFVHYDFM